MKKVLLFIVLVTIAKTYSQTSAAWQLVWEDDFNRKDIFSTAVWSKIPRCEKIDWCNTMSDRKSLFKIKKGNLILSGKPNSRRKTDPNQYITGGVFTKGKMYFTFGRIEVRCKLEGVQGSWPAIGCFPKVLNGLKEVRLIFLSASTTMLLYTKPYIRPTLKKAIRSTPNTRQQPPSAQLTTMYML